MLDLIRKGFFSFPSTKPVQRRFRSGRSLVIVGMVDSSHFQKWINELAKLSAFKDIWIFPSDCPKSKFNLKYSDGHARIKRFNFKLGPFLNWAVFQLFDLLLGKRWRTLMLARNIKKLSPDTIHFHEIQHGAYLFNEVAHEVKGSARVITSTWGSDILLYSQVHSHIPLIKNVLTWTDVLTSERTDDYSAAKSLGFQGEFIAPMYITLGLPQEKLQIKPLPSLRRGIIIKGYQDVTGRALNILRALDLLGRTLEGYDIYIYSTEKSPAVRVQAEILATKHNLKIFLLEKMDHSQLMEYFLKSKIYIGMAISDGLSTSMVEAMAHGAFPIQSENSAASEFIEHGISGMILDPWDIQKIASAIQQSLNDDSRLNKAAEINLEVIKRLYSLDNGILQMKSLYRNT